MKKTIRLAVKSSTLILIVLFLASCQKYKKEIERLSTSKDSIQGVVGQRDATILDYVSSFNEIQDRLDSIKTVQKVMSVQLAGGGTEFQTSEKEQIIEDINLLNNLINENKKQLEILRQKLSSSNKRIAELEKMLENMARQIEEKDVEIIALNNQLEQMKFDISQLNVQVSDLTAESKRKSETIEKQKDLMNVAYYCFGTKDELIKNNVIEKTGGVVGLGKSLKIKDDFNRDYFLKVDVREFKDVMLMVKKAELITVHPEGSYHFTGGDKSVEGLVIDDPTQFWGATKYLVIMVELNKK
jgi:predicted  nucleic acid-binding Zn-ribbon protein